MANKKLLILPFSSNKNRYIFDNVTGETIPSDEMILYIINNYYSMDFSEMSSNYTKAQQADFQSKYSYVSWMIEQNMFYIDTDAECERVVPNKIAIDDMTYGGSSQLILVLTEKCNMRCEYCVYSEKYPKEISYSDQELDYDSALVAIHDFMQIHKKKVKRGYTKPPMVTFYGGEPLLKFKLMKQLVEYIEKLESQTIFFMTTNGTLLEREIAEFIADHNFSVTFSMDGYKENHDRNRVTAGQNPTFDHIMEKIKVLQEIKREKNISHIISFNCCFDNYTDLLKCAEFFEVNYELFYPFYTSYVNISPFDTSYYDWSREKLQYNHQFNEAAFAETYEKIKEMFFDNSFKNDRFKEIVCGLFLGYFSTLIRSKWISSPLHNSCIPLGKLAVYPDGTYALCEKMNKKLPIGNVSDGIKSDLLEHYANLLYDNFQYKECSTCSISKLCPLCFMFMDENGKVNSDFCEMQKLNIVQRLGEIYTLLESDPNLIGRFILNQDTFDIIHSIY